MPQESGTTSELNPATESTGRQYMVVARRYRPQTFTELVGQDHVAQALSNAITNARVGHAYLFTGARGTGKTSTARIFAKALNCVHGPTPTPCNECDICRCISTGDDVDVIEIDGASNRGIDEIRELRSRVNVRPSRARFKIYIIDEVHMLTREAFNALLKTLEEPPEHVKFIFCTTEAEKIPITILSRCQRFDFVGVQANRIADRLKQIAAAENVEIDDDAVESLARRAAGSMRDSQSLLEQLFSFGGQHITLEDVHRLLGTANSERLGKLLESVIARDAAGALSELDRAIAEGVDLGQLLVQLVGYLRDVMVAAVGGTPEQFLYAHRSDIAAVQSAAKSLGINTLLAMMQILDQTMARLRVSTHGRILTELAIVRLCQLENLDELSAQIERVQQGLPAGPPPAGPRSAPANNARPVIDHSTTPAAAVPARSPTTASSTSDGSGSPSIAAPTPASTTAPQLSEAAATAPPAKKNGPPESQQPAIADMVNAALAVSADLDAARGHDVPDTHAPDEPAQRPAMGPITTDAQARQLWQAALEQISGLIGEQAACAKEVSLAETGGGGTATSAPIQLVITFDAQYNLYRRACEQPANTARIEQALAQVAGLPVRIKFAEVVTEKKDAPSPPPVANRQQRLSDLADHPLVQRAKELFGAKPVALSEPAPASVRD